MNQTEHQIECPKCNWWINKERAPGEAVSMGFYKKYGNVYYCPRCNYMISEEEAKNRVDGNIVNDVSKEINGKNIYPGHGSLVCGSCFTVHNIHEACPNKRDGTLKIKKNESQIQCPSCNYIIDVDEIEKIKNRID